MRGIVALLLVMSLLAGCTSDDAGPQANAEDEYVQSELPPANDATPAEQESTPNEGAPASNETGESSATVDQPPTLAINASMVTGTAPIDITFDLTGTDVEGSELAWLFDADGDGLSEAEGESLPANFTMTYEAAGTFNATLWATDGTNNVTEVIAITIAAPNSVEHWYISGIDDGSCVTGTLVANLANAAGGLSCTFMGQNPVFGPTIGALIYEMPSEAPSVGHPAGTEVNGEIYMSWLGGAIGTVDVTLQVDGAPVGAGSASFTHMNDGMTAVPFSFATTAEIPNGATVTIIYDIEAPHAPAAFAHGTGGSAPSGFALGGAYTPA